MFDNAVAATVMSFIFTLARGINYSFYLKSKKRLNRKFYNKITPNIKNVFNQKSFLLVFWWNYQKKYQKFVNLWIWKFMELKEKMRNF